MTCGRLQEHRFRWLQKRVDNGIVRDRDVLGWCFLDWSLELNKQAGAQGVLLYAMQSAIAIAQELRENRGCRMLKRNL